MQIVDACIKSQVPPTECFNFANKSYLHLHEGVSYVIPEMMTRIQTGQGLTNATKIAGGIRQE